MLPIVLRGLTANMNIYNTKSFRLTILLIVIAIEEEALQIANDIEYRLTLAVFIQDLRHRLRLARGTNASACYINVMTVYDKPSLLHSSVKSSRYS